MRFYESHPRLLIGIIGIVLVVLWNVYGLLAGGGSEPVRGKAPAMTQHDRDFVIALYQLTQANLTESDKVGVILKTDFTPSRSQGEDRDTECSGGKRATDVDVYTPSDNFRSKWRVKNHEDVLMEAASGITRSDSVSDPQFAYTVTRPRRCNGDYASAPVPWGFARFITARAFSCITLEELKRAFPKLAKDSWSNGSITTYRAINSQNDEGGTMLIASDDGGACLAGISVAGGKIWGTSYRVAETKYLQCEGAVRTAFAQQYPEPREDHSSLAAAHQSAPAHERWDAQLHESTHQNCGGEPYFPDLLFP